MNEMFLIVWALAIFVLAMLGLSNLIDWFRDKKLMKNLKARALYQDVENVVELREIRDRALETEWVKINGKMKGAAAKGLSYVKIWNDTYQWNSMMIRRLRSVGFKVKEKNYDDDIKFIRVSWEGKGYGKKSVTKIDTKSEEDND